MPKSVSKKDKQKAVSFFRHNWSALRTNKLYRVAPKSKPLDELSLNLIKNDQLLATFHNQIWLYKKHWNIKTEALLNYCPGSKIQTHHSYSEISSLSSLA